MIVCCCRIHMKLDMTDPYYHAITQFMPLVSSSVLQRKLFEKERV